MLDLHTPVVGKKEGGRQKHLKDIEKEEPALEKKGDQGKKVPKRQEEKVSRLISS